MHFLDRSGQARVVATAADDRQLIEAVRQLEPDVGGRATGARRSAAPSRVTAILALDTREIRRLAAHGDPGRAPRGFFLWPGDRDAARRGRSPPPSSRRCPRTGGPWSWPCTVLVVVSAPPSSRPTWPRRSPAVSRVRADRRRPAVRRRVCCRGHAQEGLHTLADLLPMVDELAPAQLDEALWTHPEGFRVLAAPSPERAAADRGGDVRSGSSTPPPAERTPSSCTCREPSMQCATGRPAIGRPDARGAVARRAVVPGGHARARGVRAARRARPRGVRSEPGFPQRDHRRRCRRGCSASQPLAVLPVDRAVGRAQDHGRRCLPGTGRIGRRSTGSRCACSRCRRRWGGGVRERRAARARRAARLRDSCARGWTLAGSPPRRAPSGAVAGARGGARALLRASGAILPQRELTRMVNEVSDEVVGFGPIEFLLKDPEVTEVMVNGPDDVYVERGGRIERAPDGLFEGEEAVLHLIERIVGPLGLRVDESSPWADARLPDGSRVHAIVPPLSLRGPALTIRKFSPVPIKAERPGGRGRPGPAHAAVPGVGRPRSRQHDRQRRRRQRQDHPARRPQRVHPRRRAAHHDRGRRGAAAGEAARRLARGAAGQRRRQGQVTVRDLVRNALRMRPDRIIVGEVRGGEALDMLQAMNTGHEGSLSTAHANSTRHLLWRLETMAMMSDVDLPAAHIRNQVASAIDVVVHLARLPRRASRRVGDRRDRGHPSGRARRRAAVPVPSARGPARVRSKRRAPCRRSPPRSPIAARTSGTGCSLPGADA